MIRIAVFPKNTLNKCHSLKQMCDSKKFEVFEIESLDDPELKEIKPACIITTMCFLKSCLHTIYSKLLFIPLSIVNNSIEIHIKGIKEIQCNGQSTINEIIYLSQTKIYLTWLGIEPNALSILVKNTIIFLEENGFATEIYISSSLGKSKEHFSKLFRDELDITFTKFRLWFRVSKMLFLFKMGQNNIHDIAYMLNYSSTENIYRDLNRTINLNPKNIIKKINNGKSFQYLFKSWKNK